MNRHPGPLSHAFVSGILVLATASGAILTTAPAHAQATPGATLSDADKTGTSASGETINAFISAHVVALNGTDAAARSAARDALIEGVIPRSGNASASFLSRYAQALNGAIAPALASEVEVVRLNAAIVVAKVAERADNLELRPAVLSVLKDKSPYVAVWGLKGARALLPVAMRNAAVKVDEDLGAVLKAAATHGAGPMGGPIILDTYGALVLDVTNADQRKRAPDAMVKMVVPANLQVLQQRVTAYKNGIPPEPLAEREALSFLTLGRVWSLLTPEQRAQAMQLMIDLLGLAAQHVPAAQGINADKLRTVISHTAAAMTVTPEVDGNAAVKAALVPATKLTGITPADQVAEAVAPIFEAIKSIKQYAALNPPPAVAAASVGTGGDKEIVETTQPVTSSATQPTTQQLRPVAPPPTPAVPPPAPATPAPANPKPAAPPPGGNRNPAGNGPAAPNTPPRNTGGAGGTGGAAPAPTPAR